MKKASIRVFYDRYYSALTTEPKPPPDPPNLQKYKERYKTMLLNQVAANIRSCSLALDAGCGNGVNLFGVSAWLPDSALGVGVDISGFQIKEAVAHSKEFNIKNLGFIVGDINKLPLRRCNFDTVICAEVLEHLHRPANALREFGDVMRLGGALCKHLRSSNILILKSIYARLIHAPHDTLQSKHRNKPRANCCFTYK